jgi:hypothetical protein
MIKKIQIYTLSTTIIGGQTVGGKDQNVQWKGSRIYIFFAKLIFAKKKHLPPTCLTGSNCHQMIWWQVSHFLNFL